MKKILALVLALMLVLGMTSAFAVSITVARHGSYDAEAGGTREYTWYRVFKASYASNTSTGGGVNDAGEVGAVTASAANAAYTANAAVAAKLGSWDASASTWSRATGNEWFDLAPIAGSTNFSVTWVGANTAERAAAAAAWLLEQDAYEDSGSLTWNDTTKKWEATGLDAGYYLLEGSEGANLVAATSDINITEKDTYPPINKKQKKENGTYQDAPLPAEIGSYIYYQVTIDVPNDANKSIAVFDKMSSGLEFDATEFDKTETKVDGLIVKANNVDVPYTAITSTNDHVSYDANNTFQILFADATVEGLQGQTITIEYRAKVTEAALRDTGKENEVTLDYNNHHYWIPDKVKYEVYFAGIYKVDPADPTADMSGVKFALTSGGDAVNVSYDSTNGYYYVDPTSNSNIVETRADDEHYTIKIRGLDNDKDYILTETENPHEGYNLLASPVTLTKTKDEGDAFASKPKNTFDKVENNKGTTLPSTGGMGTTILYIAGSILVLGAVIFLVTKRRMKAED